MMTSLTPISKKRTLSEEVAAQVMAMISSGTFKVGAKLPPESDLCQSLRVGRSTLREGLRALSLVGMVRMRPGEGTFVAEGSSEFLDRAFGHGLLREASDIRDLFETRILLETRLAALCARRATQEELQHLDHLVMEMTMAAHSNPRNVPTQDLEFHLKIAAYSRNRVMAQLFRNMRHILYEWLVKCEQIPGAQANACYCHQKILDALKQRDPRKASSAMRSHLNNMPLPYKLLLGTEAGGSSSQEA